MNGGTRRGAAIVLSAVAFTGALSGCNAVKKAKQVADAAKALGNLPGDVKDLDAKLAAAANATYSAEYSEENADGSDSKVLTIDQKPPNFRWVQGDAQFFQDSQFFYTCGKGVAGGDGVACTKTPAPTDGSTPAGFVFGLNLPALLQSFRVFAIIPGIKIKKSTRDEAGQKLDCVTVTDENNKDSKPLEACSTAEGILGYYSDGNSVFRLTKFSDNVDDKAFELPGPAFTQDELQAEIERRNTTTTERTTTTRATTTTTEPDEETTTTTEPDESTTTTDVGATTTTTG